MGRRRKPYLVMVIGQHHRARALLVNVLSNEVPHVILTTAENLREAMMCMDMDEPAPNELLPRVIVYCPADEQPPSEVNAACARIASYTENAKRRVAKIILFTGRVMLKPAVAEVTMIMQPDIRAVCDLVKRHAPRGFQRTPKNMPSPKNTRVL